MTNLVPMKQPCANIVESIQSLLDEAREGRISAIGFVILQPGPNAGDFGVIYDAGVRLPSLLGLLPFLERAIIQNQDKASGSI